MGKVHNLDDETEFRDIGIIDANDVETIFKHYSSPLTTNGKTLIEEAIRGKINPALLVAIIQKECSYGVKANNKSLDERNIANPFSIHFRTKDQLEEGEQPKDMLRPSKGVLPTFRQSASAAVNTLDHWKSKGNGALPFSAVAAYYSEKPDIWKKDVMQYYLHILFLLKKK